MFAKKVRKYVIFREFQTTERGNLAIFLPLILCEINFGYFQKVKNCHLSIFGGFEFPKNSKFRAAKIGSQNGSFFGGLLDINIRM